jgi:hypothetical protein
VIFQRVDKLIVLIFLYEVLNALQHAALKVIGGKLFNPTLGTVYAARSGRFIHREARSDELGVGSWRRL